MNDDHPNYEKDNHPTEELKPIDGGGIRQKPEPKDKSNSTEVHGESDD